MKIKSLLSTTFTSSIDTHSRLKDLNQHFGMTDDIVSRLAISYSLKLGAIDDDWSVTPYEGMHHIVTGKSIRGKTMFKEDLTLWLVLIALHEPNCKQHDLRQKFLQHWERGVELLSNDIVKEDWIETLDSLL
jgi:DNA sulfur modification protein DndE